MLNTTLAIARKYGSKAAALTALAGASVPAFAQSTNPFEVMLESIGIGGVVAAVVAFGLTVVALTMAFQSIVVAKRGVKKI